MVVEAGREGRREGGIRGERGEYASRLCSYRLAVEITSPSLLPSFPPSLPASLRKPKQENPPPQKHNKERWHTIFPPSLPPSLPPHHFTPFMGVPSGEDEDEGEEAREDEDEAEEEVVLVVVEEEEEGRRERRATGMRRKVVRSQ